MTTNFIQKIVKHEQETNHVGMTHDLIGVPREFNLSTIKPLLKLIVKTPIGETIDNPTKFGKRKYKITKKLKQHVNSALNLINISQNYYKNH